MKMSTEHWRNDVDTERKPVNMTLSTEYLTWIDPESNAGLCGERPASKHKIGLNKHEKIQLLPNR